MGTHAATARRARLTVENIEAMHFHGVICQWWRIIRHQVCQAQAPAQEGGDDEIFRIEIGMELIACYSLRQ
jgi:hypothetical protein